MHRHAVLPKRLVEVVAEITGGGWPDGFDELSTANHCLHDFVLRPRFRLVWLSESQPVNRNRFGVLDCPNDRIPFVVEEIPFRSVRMVMAFA
mgnify:CR=1 FL=1